MYKYYSIPGESFFESNTKALLPAVMLERGYVLMDSARPSDLHICEAIDDDTGQWVIPALTFEDELEELNRLHDIKVNELVIDYNKAMTYDGSTETEKVSLIREELMNESVEYELEASALMVKYFGE